MFNFSTQKSNVITMSSQNNILWIFHILIVKLLIVKLLTVQPRFQLKVMNAFDEPTLISDELKQTKEVLINPST